jgi:hypothetical protein
MDWLEEVMIQCPQCGEDFFIQIETAFDGTVELIEDCAVCCRPALIRVETSSGQVSGIDVQVS